MLVYSLSGVENRDYLMNKYDEDNGSPVSNIFFEMAKLF